MKTRQRIQLQPAFLLHRRPFRESSVIAEFLSRDHGRVALVVRGGRGQASRRCLEVFTPLLVSWSARGELGTLTAVEAASPGLRLAQLAVFSAYYANELLLRMVHKGESVPELYNAYCTLLESLAAGDAVALPLRLFEKRLLQGLGYGADLAREWQSGCALDPAGLYRISPEQGPEPVSVGVADGSVFSGSSLLSLDREELADAQSLRDARRLLRIWLDYYLEGRPLKSREVMRALYGKRARRQENAVADVEA